MSEQLVCEKGLNNCVGEQKELISSFILLYME